ncbi:SDR family oxidoreductase [Streptomyces sp. NPDC059578]|uniref:SDR family oxidoreductase n=1 Tax=unclassified Streptomyces TaxID=2593676 RepID=UPI00365D83B8
MTTTVVTGGTGTLGRQVVDRLREAGHTVRVVSRRAQPYAVDLVKGSGPLDEALRGADVVVHCASGQRGDEVAARRLIEAVRRAGVGHLVYISIVGVDRVPLGYYRTKWAVERLIEASGTGWTILRTTQFHDLVLTLLTGLAKPPVMFVPAGVADQPIGSGEVADRLAELADGTPAGRVPELGGPQVRDLGELATAYLAASGRRRRTVRVPLPGKVARALRAGGHLTPDRAVGRETFEAFLTRVLEPSKRG